MMALLWTCTSCGFLIEGRQPHMECPSCEAYKTSFVNLPQHLEMQVRAEFSEVRPNATAAREHRLKLAEEAGVFENFMVKGRFLP